MDEPIEAPRQQEDARGPTGLQRIRLAFFGRLSSLFVRLLGTTWRLHIIGRDPRAGTDPSSEIEKDAQLAAFFHESLLPAAFCFRDRSYSVAVSRSRDGDLIEATLRRLGYAEAARGSSSRGGSAALLGLVRRLEAGTTVAVLVDGPRGPARVSKSGIITLARVTGRPIQPIAFSARPAIRLGSWDQGLIPLPFARVVCAFGEPFEVDGEEASDEQTQATMRRLDRRLTALHHEADSILLSS